MRRGQGIRRFNAMAALSRIRVFCLDSEPQALHNTGLDAGIAQLVERNLAKVEVASSNLVSRSRSLLPALTGS